MSIERTNAIKEDITDNRGITSLATGTPTIREKRQDDLYPCALLCFAVLFYSVLKHVIERLSLRNIRKIVLTIHIHSTRTILSFTDFGE
jgi:hypothetical protein